MEFLQQNKVTVGIMLVLICIIIVLVVLLINDTDAQQEKQGAQPVQIEQPEQTTQIEQREQNITIRAEDARKLSDIRAVQSAVEIERINEGFYPAPSAMCVQASTLALKSINVDISFAGEIYYSVDDIANPTKYRLVSHLVNANHSALDNDLDNNVNPNIATGTKCDCSQPNAYCIGTQ